MRGKIGLTGFALLLLGIGLAQADPLQIRGAWVAPIANWSSIWLQKKDLAVHFGQSYVFAPTRYAGTPPMITAIANNELEIGNLAFSTLPIAIENAGMDDIRVITDDFQDGVPGYASNEFEVLADGPIKTIEDLKGKVVATNAAGSGVDVAVRAMLRKHGLEANRDYTIIEAPFPAMKAMLAEKKVDMIPAVLPFLLDPELKKIARPLFSSADAIGVSQFVMWSARKPFIDAHRAASGRLPGRYAAHRALVSRPEKSRRGRRDRCRAHQAAARALRLAVHQERLLPRSQYGAGPRCAAEERRHDEGSRLCQSELRRQGAFRSQPDQGGGEAAAVIPIRGAEERRPHRHWRERCVP